jgi:ATP-dependent RNA helicase DeaD
MPTLKAIDKLGFERPSEIQKETIPILLKGDRDLIGLAQTGTGKTAAFGLPLIESIDDQAQNIEGLILSPTRELARQITDQLEKFSKFHPHVRILSVYGGANIGAQIKDIKRGQSIVVATPGRLMDLIRRKAIKLEYVRRVILDEADEMLKMGFKEDVEFILSHTPQEKRVWLFSATMPKMVMSISKKYMEDPIEVRINPKQSTNANIEHYKVVVKNAHKTEALKRFIDSEQDLRGVVFCRTRRDTKDLSEHLFAHNYKAEALHGELSQSQRDRVMRRFRNGEVQILIATDVAARGIDVDNLTHIFHYSLPDDDDFYTHRAGRTARAGKEGVSIAFVNNRQLRRIDELKKKLKIQFHTLKIPSAADVVDQRIQEWCARVITKGESSKVSKKLLKEVIHLFSDMSKDELIRRILDVQLEDMGLNKTEDLNDKPDSRQRNSKQKFQRKNNSKRGKYGRKKPSKSRKNRAGRRK